ncbi:hypothetical protein [Streptomyces flavofungini]|uniref:Integral membrane protein n=1 Tax=Streptomyces flavofungini TaxID=68200 RepID=A0ABS0XGH3_9ACTN|nr:hypothetical protein [Streptomyces flavofungini]MBJ3812328.1 hypothetical protein [Streptomyces flavofungini]GHC88413.1 hypothetical protein GCM10010349_75680 [Streptomyces flavofungini]
MPPYPHRSSLLLLPFADDPGRLERAEHRARRQPFRTQIHTDERTVWGWLRWALPSDSRSGEDTCPLLEIGIRPPEPSLRDRCAHRWLTRRPAARVALDRGGTVTLAIALVSLIGLVLALGRDAPGAVAIPLTLLLPLLVDHLPARLDARARRRVRTVTDPASVTYLRPLVAWHAQIDHTARHHPTPEQLDAARLSHRALWDLAGLLSQPTSPPHDHRDLLIRAHLLADLAYQSVEHATAHHQLEDAITCPPKPHGDRQGSGVEGPPAGNEPTAPTAELALGAEALHDAAAAARYATGCLHRLDKSRT